MMNLYCINKETEKEIISLRNYLEKEIVSQRFSTELTVTRIPDSTL